MDLDRPQSPPDAEFGSNRPGLLSGAIEDEPEAYLRLIANPFLGLTYLVAWLICLYQGVAIGFAGPLTPMVIAMLIPAIALVPYFMQYHCLDCGATGRLGRWRKHICQKPMERREAGRPRRIRGPNPPLQVVLWVWVLLALALLVNALDLVDGSG